MYENPVVLANAFAVWLLCVGGLFLATQPAMEKFGKPFILHPLKTYLPDKLYRDNYQMIFQAVLLIVTGVVAWQFQDQLDLFGNVFGHYEFHPFVGCLPAIFASAFVGQQIHDKFGSKDLNNA